MLEIFLNLDKIQQWFLIIMGTIAIGSSLASIIYLIIKNGFKAKGVEIMGLSAREKQELPEYQKQDIWEREIKIPNKKGEMITAGSIGFIKDIIIFKFFGTFWNSADPETKDIYDKFSEEFRPPMWLEEKYRKEVEAFVFLENSNIQSKLLPIIREQAALWKHVFVIGSWIQIQGQELAMLSPESNAPENITILSAPRGTK
jgi:hypothetical protein